MMSSGLLTSILHRLGVVRALQPLWRRDQEKADERSAGRARKLVDHAGDGWRQRVREEIRAESRQELEAVRHEVEAVRHDYSELAERWNALEQLARGLEQTLERNREERGLLARFQAATSSHEVSEHVARAIAGATLTEDPAPLLTINQVFPPEIYDIVLASIPPRAAFDVKDRTKSNFRAHRPASAIPDLSATVCTYVERELIPRIVAPALVQRFAPFIASYYDELFGPTVGPVVAALPLEATAGRLMRRTRGYHLDPHLDPKRVLLTALFYLARPGDPDSYGTSFYRIDGRLVRDHSSTYYPGHAGHTCELVRVVPFHANTGAVFLNSAAHGADIPASAPRDTERFAYQVYIGPQVDSLQALIRTLPAGEQQRWAGPSSD